MPVIGHAVAGLALGVSFHPVPWKTDPIARRDFASTFWLPMTVAVAYLPDIAAQILSLAGLTDARTWTHSILAGTIASLVLAPVVSRLFSMTLRKGFAILFVSILGHVFLDMAQSTDRMPFWPISVYRIPANFQIIPSGMASEGLLFTGIILLYLALLRTWKKHMRPGSETSVEYRFTSFRRNVPGLSLVMIIFLFALSTHILRGQRENEMETARMFVRNGRNLEALQLVNRSDRWPSTTRSGRCDYLRGEIHFSLGDRALAERYYLLSYRADPDWFWVVADLAYFYASSDRPNAERRRLAQPYINRLGTDFGESPEVLHAMSRVGRKLQEPASGFK